MRSATCPKLEHSPKSHLFLRAWLVCVAVSYPIFWLSDFLTRALSALVQVVFFGYHLGVFRVLPFGAYAWSAPPHNFDPLHPHPMAHLNLTPGSLVWIVLACAALVIILSRKPHLLAGLFLAALGNFALAQQFALIFYSHHATLATVIAALFFLAALCWGLRAMLPAGIENYWSRIGFLLAAFVLPLSLLLLVLARSPVQRNILLLAIPPIGAALLSSFSGRLRFQNTGAAPGWKLIVGGAII